MSSTPKKFELTAETRMAPDGTTLYRIRALVSFGTVVAGVLGGFVASEANLSHGGDAWVSGNARVFGNAQVYGNAWVYGNARVYGDARVSDNARVFGNAWVYGNARVYVAISCATRSDLYTFLVTPDKDGVVRIIAGCRYFTIAEARAHWLSTRGGTPLGEESLAIVDHLERIARIRGWLQ